MSAMKLLVVDDEPAILKYMHALLTDWGHQVVSLCFNGEQTAADVLEQVKVQKFDVALVGFMMPAMLGTELAAQIKRLSPATKIVIMIESVPPAIADAVRREGVNFGQLPAPFEREKLFRQLSGVI
jgi:CheY-like chemotaxis protein